MSKNKVVCDMFEKTDSYDVEHISLAQKADAFLVCPATANIIGKVANGIADDFLSTTIMATKAPVIFALGMNTNMYQNPIVQSNIEKLKEYGYLFIDADEGFLACGTTGKGRLADPEVVVDYVNDVLTKKDLLGKNVLVSAGPTCEAFDPVRYITNHSSGKMGYEIARAARNRGANVTLVSGKTSLKPPAGVKFVQVFSAREMHEAMLENFAAADIVIKSAAVADYRPSDVSIDKIKKDGDQLNVTLVKNPDILKSLGEKKTKQILIGFCMETKDLIENATKKLISKNLDFIVANNLTTEGAGFGGDTNIVTILGRNGEKEDFGLMSKFDLANVILDKTVK